MQTSKQDTIITRRFDVAWLPPDSTYTLYLRDVAPALKLVTSVHGFSFIQDKLLMINHEIRGWDIPGGHLEPGESAEQALKRELREEGEIVAEQLKLFAVGHIHLHGAKPSNYKYPYPDSYQLFYVTGVDEVKPFSGAYETKAREFFAPGLAYQLDWVKQHSELYEIALKLSAK